VRKFPLLRAERQLAQLQFHCGTPPPAAEPRIRICTAVKETGAALGATFFGSPALALFAGVHVGRDFHAQADFFKFRFDPDHIFVWLIVLATIIGIRCFSRKIFSFGFWWLLLACFHARAIFGFSADFGQHAKPDRI